MLHIRAHDKVSIRDGYSERTILDIQYCYIIYIDGQVTHQPRHSHSLRETIVYPVTLISPPPK